MKSFWVLLFIVVYFSGLFFIYYEFPEKIIEEEGEVYFYSCYDYDCGQIILDLAENTNEEKCAFYDLDEPRLVKYFEENDDALLVYEENYVDGLGTSVKINGLMHHKFCVFDDEITLTGSWNPTVRGTENNDNYVVVINSKTIADKFLEEYDRIENKERDGSSGLKINLSGVLIDVCFSPNNDCSDSILDEINKAEISVSVLAFSFTNKEIANALINASLRNVSVKVVFEKTRISTYSVYSYLNESGVGVYFDGNKYTMHDKLFLIDNKTAIIGSYNPSSSAENSNDENLVVITDYEKITEVEREFDRVFNQVN